MAHTPTLVLVPDSANDIEEEVAQLLLPYHIQIEPYKVYLDNHTIQRMAEHYKTENLEQLAQHVQTWFGYEGGVDGEGLYKITTYNPEGHWDYWLIGGLWDDGLKVKGKHVFRVQEFLAITNEDPKLFPVALVAPDGTWHQDDQVGGVEITIEERQNAWQNQVISILQSHPDYLVVCCDLHY